jgi:hypothetical protein
VNNAWKTSASEQHGGRTRRIALQENDRAVPYQEVARLWREEEPFREFFLGVLAGLPFAAYFFETPPVTLRTFGRAFEFVAIDSPELAGVPPEPEVFADAFARAPAGRDVLTFPNLGGDALLVVPRPATAAANYAHLAAFLREAPRSQQHALWQQVGAALEKQVNPRPTWLSTAGLGVYWLHVRLDARPKYYRHGPYKVMP